MQVKRICKVCGQEYYVDIDDKINLCHTCYLLAERQIKQGLIKDFNEYGVEIRSIVNGEINKED